MAAPATPQNMYVQQGNGEVLISWDICAGATTYTVQRSTDNVTFSTLSSPAVIQYLDTTAVVGTQYYYKVRANNSDGSSSYTTAQSVVPTYSGNMTLSQVRLLAQQRADRVNSNYITLPEWNTYINQSYFELYDLLVTTFEDFYLAPAYRFQTSGSSATYPLPNGSSTYLDTDGNTARPFYKLMGVDLGLDSGNNAKVTLHKFDFIQRNRYVYPSITSTFLGVFNLRYRLMGDKLHFIPIPQNGQYITVWYIPRVEQLLKDTDMLDGVSGWTEYVVVDAAIKALMKEESDVSALMLQKQMLLKRIEETAMNRDVGEPDTISPTRRGTGDGYGFGPGDGSYGGF